MRADERCGRKQLLVVVDCSSRKSEAGYAKRYKSETVSVVDTARPRAKPESVLFVWCDRDECCIVLGACSGAISFVTGLDEGQGFWSRWKIAEIAK